MAKIKNKKQTNLINRNFCQSLSFIKESRKFIYFAAAIFIFFILIGIFFPAPAALENYIKEALKNIAERTSGMNTLELISYIFVNNFLISAISVLFGVIFCVAPFFLAVTNGYILGYVFRAVVIKLGLSKGALFISRIIPYGIFELPAVMISLGAGIRLGTCLFSSQKDFKRNFLLSIKTLFFAILPLLVIAAVIEGILIFYLK